MFWKMVVSLLVVVGVCLGVALAHYDAVAVAVDENNPFPPPLRFSISDLEEFVMVRDHYKNEDATKRISMLPSERMLFIRNNAETVMGIYWLNGTDMGRLFRVSPGERKSVTTYVAQHFRIAEIPTFNHTCHDHSFVEPGISIRTRGCFHHVFAVNQNNMQIVTILSTYKVAHDDHTSGADRIVADLDECKTRARLAMKIPLFMPSNKQQSNNNNYTLTAPMLYQHARNHHVVLKNPYTVMKAYSACAEHVTTYGLQHQNMRQAQEDLGVIACMPVYVVFAFFFVFSKDSKYLYRTTWKEPIPKRLRNKMARRNYETKREMVVWLEEPKLQIYVVKNFLTEQECQQALDAEDGYTTHHHIYENDTLVDVSTLLTPFENTSFQGRCSFGLCDDNFQRLEEHCFKFRYYGKDVFLTTPDSVLFVLRKRIYSYLDSMFQGSSYRLRDKIGQENMIRHLFTPHDDIHNRSSHRYANGKLRFYDQESTDDYSDVDTTFLHDLFYFEFGDPPSYVHFHQHSHGPMGAQRLLRQRMRRGEPVAHARLYCGSTAEDPVVLFPKVNMRIPMEKHDALFVIRIDPHTHRSDRLQLGLFMDGDLRRLKSAMFLSLTARYVDDTGFLTFDDWINT